MVEYPSDRETDHTHTHTTEMASATTLKFTEDQLLVLLSAIEAEHTDCMSPEELADHDKIHSRIVKALNRIKN